MYHRFLGKLATWVAKASPAKVTIVVFILLIMVICILIALISNIFM